ncbi:hypothetical protein [Burkholderia ubonensis]|uniref:hypothetical protein n=1 Tax=Burkholderia ubonensis TaxID=101571 RepID=UPI000B3344E2|nr:hypothetical protein [Burkholderia ubonensis]
MLIVYDRRDHVKRQELADIGSFSSVRAKYLERTPVRHKPVKDKKIVDVCQPKPFQRLHALVGCITAEKWTKRY